MNNNTTEKEKIYAVCNLGSTEISVMIARKMPNGYVSPIAMERELANHSIDKGCIHNIDDTVSILRRLIDSLERQLPYEGSIDKIYVGINSRSLCSKTCECSLDLDNEGEIINAEHISTLRKKIDVESFPGYHKVMVVDPKFFVDGKREVNPKGVKCRNIKAKYQIILVRESIVETIYETIQDRLNIKIASILVNPIAEAHVSLTNEDFTLGCAYINIGGGVTTVSVFKERLLSSLFVIPVGGINVTKDIMSKNLLWRDAEKLKITKASMDLLVDKEEEVTILSQNGIGKKTLLQLDLNSIVSARMVELILNVFSIMKELGYGSDLAGGIVIGGRGAKIAGLSEYLNSVGAEYRFASIRKDVVDESVEDINLLDNSTLLGLVSMASENCVSEKPDNLEDLLFQNDNKEQENDENKEEDDTLYTNTQPLSNEVNEDWLDEDEEDKEDTHTHTKNQKKKNEKIGWFNNVWNKITDFMEGSSED